MTSKCWRIDNVCGFSLSHGVMFAGFATLIISFVAMVTALITVKETHHEDQYNNKPVQAINMIISLYCFSISMYQIIISLMLLSKRSPFLCSVWFVSHATILTLYTLMLIAKAVVNCKARQYIVAMLTIIAAIIYEGVMIFFMIVVHSYMVMIR